MGCVFAGRHTRSRLARPSQGRCLGLSQPIGIRALLIPPHFFDRRTSALDSFIDIVGQNWPRIARFRTPLQRTVVQRAPLPMWPQLSRVAWAKKNVIVFQVIKRRCPASLVYQVLYNSINRHAGISNKNRRYDKLGTQFFTLHLGSDGCQ